MAKKYMIEVDIDGIEFHVQWFTRNTHKYSKDQGPVNLEDGHWTKDIGGREEDRLGAQRVDVLTLGVRGYS